MNTLTQHSCSVIPPHMQQHMAQHGDAEQRKRVASTLEHTKYLTQERAAAFRVDTPSATVPQQKQRNVYDCAGRRVLPGKLVMSEHGRTSSDIAAREAFDGAGATYDFLANVFNRNSIDGRGMRLDSSVHYGSQFDNALWDGRQMVYGDGDGTLFTRFTAAKDVIGHELMHGVTQYTAALEYIGESGALNESMSDVVGIMVKQRWLNQTVLDSNWLIGEGLYGPEVRGRAIRSMKAPGTAYDDPILGKDPQPAHMRDYVRTTDDNGGVHINSGIPNHAFYLAAMSLGRYSWLVAGKIWFVVLTTKLTPTSGFQDFANATVIVAGEIYSLGGGVQAAIARAWERVGLPVPSSLTERPEGFIADHDDEPEDLVN
ncbi:MAG TPA: M4 family metallopeptidase [Thermoanaerobaculia bacterium]|nr:M4 family metallopeptidase [Thermoanaerobaculia bacterium]